MNPFEAGLTYWQKGLGYDIREEWIWVIFRLGQNYSAVVPNSSRRRPISPLLPYPHIPPESGLSSVYARIDSFIPIKDIMLAREAEGEDGRTAIVERIYHRVYFACSFSA